MSPLPCRAVNLLEMKLFCDCSYYLRDLNANRNKQLPSEWNKVKATHVNSGMKKIARTAKYTAMKLEI